MNVKTLSTQIFTLITVAILAFLSSCQQVENNPQDPKALLSSTKWQLTAESGLNLAADFLADNIIELKDNGNLVYYDKAEKLKIFTETRWRLTEDKKKLVEILPDGTQIQSEIVELNDTTLKLRYEEPTGNGGKSLVTETYTSFRN
ncbi:MAG: hypothetical protein MUE85_05300 [Microscillaceae bacterium]|jgi:hypothetical protein|nr:hypothetical protein [Microscillaceae bacterium]